METADSTETLVTTYKITQCDILEDSNISIYRSDNLKPRIQTRSFGGTKSGLKGALYVLYAAVNTS
jgi:uncharacterized protein YabE (DUF348 family)